MKQLTSLDISHCDIDRAGFENIVSMQNLRVLSIGAYNTPEHYLTYLCGMSNLRHLNTITDNKPTAECIKSITLAVPQISITAEFGYRT